jgi:hypothetical protein
VGERRGPSVLAALAPVALLALDPAGWFPFGPVKWLAVSTLVLGGSALVLADRPVRVHRTLLLAVGALLAWLAVAAAVGLDPVYAWTGTPERHLGVLTWALAALALVVGGSLDATRDARVLATGLAAAGLGVGATATAEALGWEPEVFDAGTRLTATLGSSAYLGAVTALLIPISIGIALDRGLPPWVRRAGGTAVPLLLVAVAGSGARAAWVGLVAAAIAAGVSRRPWRRATPAAVVASVVVGAVAVALLVALSPVGDRLSSLTDADAPGGRGRLDEWRVASAVLDGHLLTGVGPEGYRVAFAEGVDARYERDHGRTQQPDRAHAGPLDVALAGGLPALLAWGAVVALVGRAVMGVLRRGSGWLVGVAAGLVAHVAGQLLLFPIVELEPLVWLLAGVVVAASATPPSRTVDVPRVVPIVVGALAVVALVAGIVDVTADRRAGTAVDALARGDHRAAASAAEAAVSLRPDTVRLRVLAATALVADDQGTLAGLRQLERALDVSPGDPIVLLHRARLLVERAEATHVPEHAARADDEVGRLLERDPNNAALWRLTARLAGLRGDAPAERQATATADDLTPPDQLGR